MRDRLLIALFASLLCGGFFPSKARPRCAHDRSPANLTPADAAKALKVCEAGPRLDLNLAYGPGAVPGAIHGPSTATGEFGSAPKLLGALLFLIRTGLSPPA